MNVRIALGGYICECGSAMVFLDLAKTPARRMVCRNPVCRYCLKIVLEPLFEAVEPIRHEP